MTDERLEQLRDLARGAVNCCEDNADEMVELLAEIDRLRAREVYVLFGQNSSCPDDYLGVVVGTLDDARREARRLLAEPEAGAVILIYREVPPGDDSPVDRVDRYRLAR